MPTVAFLGAEREVWYEPQQFWAKSRNTYLMDGVAFSGPLYFDQEGTVLARSRKNKVALDCIWSVVLAAREMQESCQAPPA